MTSACVVNLTGPDEPGPNGDVTGAPADCSQGPKEPGAAPQGKPGPHFVGRFSADGQFAWPGTEITARFTGTSISAILELPAADATYDPEADQRVFTVTVDGSSYELPVKAGNRRYDLASGLDPAATHEVVLHREFEASGGLAKFGGFELAPGGAFAQPIVRNRRIEIVGDSISCGYGVLGSDGSCQFSYGTERHSLTYGAIAARTLDAELSTVAWSGKGLLRNENGDEGGQPAQGGGTAEAMPELYGTVAAASVPGAPQTGLAFTPDKASPPQAVLVHLGTNDFNAGVVDAAFEARGEAFLKTIRAQYPEAHVFFALSPMLSDQLGPQVRTRAAASLKAIVERSGDPRAYYMQFSEQRLARDGLGCNGHPSKRTHEIVASQLVKAIQEKLCW